MNTFHERKRERVHRTGRALRAGTSTDTFTCNAIGSIAPQLDRADALGVVVEVTLFFFSLYQQLLLKLYLQAISPDRPLVSCTHPSTTKDAL